MIFTGFYTVQGENSSLYWLLNSWVQSKSVRKLGIRDLSTFSFTKYPPSSLFPKLKHALVKITAGIQHNLSGR